MFQTLVSCSLMRLVHLVILEGNLVEIGFHGAQKQGWWENVWLQTWCPHHYVVWCCQTCRWGTFLQWEKWGRRFVYSTSRSLLDLYEDKSDGSHYFDWSTVDDCLHMGSCFKSHACTTSAPTPSQIQRLRSMWRMTMDIPMKLNNYHLGAPQNIKHTLRSEKRKMYNYCAYDLLFLHFRTSNEVLDHQSEHWKSLWRWKENLLERSVFCSNQNWLCSRNRVGLWWQSSCDEEKVATCLRVLVENSSQCP